MIKNKNTAAVLNKPENYKNMVIVFSVAIFSRLLIFLVCAVAMKFMNYNKPFSVIFGESGDVPHYIYIAEHWYQSSGEKSNLIVFYPLFPMLIAIFRIIFRSYLLSAIIISYLSFGVASCYLYKLLKLSYDDERVADGMIAMFMGIFGVFFMSAHTESLFLMLSAMCLYYAVRRNWLICGITGFLAALTKTQGLVLVIPVVYEAVIYCVNDKKFSRTTLFSLLIPIGFLCYLILNKAVAGDFFKFMEYQEAAPWYNSPKWIAESIETSYGVGQKNFSLSLIIYWPQIILYFVSVAAIFVGIYKKVRTLYLLYIGAYVGLTYMHGWMLSGGRYITSCIGMYIVFASIDNKHIRNSLLLICGALFTVFSILWMRGYAIM